METPIQESLNGVTCHSAQPRRTRFSRRACTGAARGTGRACSRRCASRTVAAGGNRADDARRGLRATAQAVDTLCTLVAGRHSRSAGRLPRRRTSVAGRTCAQDCIPPSHTGISSRQYLIISPPHIHIHNHTQHCCNNTQQLLQQSRPPQQQPLPCTPATYLHSPPRLRRSCPWDRSCPTRLLCQQDSSCRREPSR